MLATTIALDAAAKPPAHRTDADVAEPASQESSEARYPPGRDDAGGPGRAARADDTVVLGAGVLLYDLLGGGVGGELGVYLTRDTYVFADAYTGKSPFLDTASQTIGLGVTHFLGDTFYLRGSSRLRAFRSTDAVPSEAEQVETAGDDEEEVPLVPDETLLRDVGIDLAVGYRRQWGAFFLSTDVLGGYFPVVVIDRDTRLEGMSIRSKAERRIPEFRVAWLRMGLSF